MTVRIDLTGDDIAEIIAEKYGVLTSSVEVGTEDRCEGYGLAERIVKVAVAHISIPRENLHLLKQQTSANETINTEDVVFTDWYDRLSHLDFVYDPKPDGDPWYKADDVWACIDPGRKEAST